MHTALDSDLSWFLAHWIQNTSSSSLLMPACWTELYRFFNNSLLIVWFYHCHFSALNEDETLHILPFIHSSPVSESLYYNSFKCCYFPVRYSSQCCTTFFSNPFSTMPLPRPKRGAFFQSVGLLMCFVKTSNSKLEECLLFCRDNTVESPMPDVINEYIFAISAMKGVSSLRLWRIPFRSFPMEWMLRQYPSYQQQLSHQQLSLCHSLSAQ